MEIVILGIGGFYNPGIAFNAFSIDKHILVECPPDILQSLKRENIDLNEIDTIYISHTHGDHVFGIPFLLFNIFEQVDCSKKITIIGPHDLKKSVLHLSKCAISDDHPLIEWIDSSCTFIAIDNKSKLNVASYKVDFCRMVHEKETYGAGFYSDGKLDLLYLPDTRWDPVLLSYLSENPRIVLCDIGGTGGSNSVHMSIEDLELNIPEAMKSTTRIIGTHLSKEIQQSTDFMEIASQGLKITL